MPTPILKNGPKRKVVENKTSQKYNAMKSEADRILQQEEASRQFFEQFTDRMNQKESRLRQKLAESWKNPDY